MKYTRYVEIPTNGDFKRWGTRRPMQIVSLDPCQCGDERHGPRGGVCGMCGNAILSDAEIQGITEKAQTLLIYTIYDHPTDFPDEYIIRRWLIQGNAPVPEAEPFFKSKDIEECRGKMKSLGLYRLSRNEDDDPCILESWI